MTPPPDRTDETRMLDLPNKVWIDKNLGDGAPFVGWEWPAPGGVPYVLASRLTEVEKERDEARAQRHVAQAQLHAERERATSMRNGLEEVSRYGEHVEACEGWCPIEIATEALAADKPEGELNQERTK